MLHHLATQLVQVGPWGVFVGMLLESTGFPVPSEVVLPFAGWLSTSGAGAVVHGFWLLFVLAVLGQLAGALVGYAIGYFGGRPVTVAFERYTGRKHLAAAERWFDRHGAMAVFWARFLPVVRSYIPFPAGIGGMKVTKFAVLTAVGSIPWTLALMEAGRLLGIHWTVVSADLGRVTYIIAGLIVVAIVWLVVRYRRART